MKLHSNAELGLNMVSMLGILGTAQTTTAVTRHVPATLGERIAYIFYFSPHDFAVPANKHQDEVALSICDLITALQHRYLHTSLQPVGDKQFSAIKELEFFSARTIHHKQPQRLSSQ